MQRVLVLDDDHSYREASIVEKKVVFDTEYKQYFEYFGDEYLGNKEVVVTKLVVE